MINTYLMPSRRKRTLHILQTEFTDPHPSIWDTGILFWKRRIIPRLDIVGTEPNASYSEDTWFESERRYGCSWCGRYRRAVQVETFTKGRCVKGGGGPQRTGSIQYEISKGFRRPSQTRGAGRVLRRRGKLLLKDLCENDVD